MAVWRDRQAHIAVPALWEYEVISGLRRAVALGILTTVQGIAAAAAVADMAFDVVAPSIDLHRLALHWADRLGQSKAYVAQYIALASSLGGALWTTDAQLANNAQQAGAAWVHWIGED